MIPVNNDRNQLPSWANEMRDLFRSGSAAQFLLHGNVFDVVPHGGKLLSVPAFLEQVMFASYDVVLRYDRSRGVRATRGGEDWGDWLQNSLGREASTQTLMREPGSALELIDRYLLRTLNLQALPGGAAGKPKRIAVIIEFAEFVVPRGDALQLGGPFAANTVKVLGWANDPAIVQSNIVTVLLSEGLHDLNSLVVENPHAAALHLPLPNEADMLAYLTRSSTTQFPDLAAKSDVPIETMAARLTGLSRVGARTAIALALGNDQTDHRRRGSAQIKKELIERECQGLLDFVESPFTHRSTSPGMDAGEGVAARRHGAAASAGALRALPMGYLIAGRIGTGKTFLVQCWAGELGIPCVVFKNFRDRWVGATESNLEKIFAILRALGQVVVFVDEADQAAGKREGGDGDSGLSGRVYSMLAKEMSDTRNRGRIIWVFATSRPGPARGRPQAAGPPRRAHPALPAGNASRTGGAAAGHRQKAQVSAGRRGSTTVCRRPPAGGNELEGVLVRALRTHELELAEPEAARQGRAGGAVA